MSAKLNISYLEFKNFLSYGNYPTKFEFAEDNEGIGSTLIIGQNGAGKSSFITALIWVLFGKTTTNSNPGNKVINWHSGSDCYVKLITFDGIEILRTRNVDGHSELLIRKLDGTDLTVSTSKNTQTLLNDMFGLDYEIFVSSIFFGQISKSFLETTPTKRKEALETILGLSQLNGYADKTKQKTKDIDSELKSLRSYYNLLNDDLSTQTNRSKSIQNSIEDFETNRILELNQTQVAIKNLSDSKKVIKLPDLGLLNDKWQNINRLIGKIADLKSEINNTANKIKSKLDILKEKEAFKSSPPYNIDVEDVKRQHLDFDVATKKEKTILEKIRECESDRVIIKKEIGKLNDFIKEWETKKNLQCYSCEQVVDEQYVESKLEDVRNDMRKLLDRKISLSNKIDKLEQYKREHLVIPKAPELSMSLAEKYARLNDEWQKKQAEVSVAIERLKLEIQELKQHEMVLVQQLSDEQDRLDSIDVPISMEEANASHHKIELINEKINHLMLKIKDLRDKENPYVITDDEIKKTISKLEESIAVTSDKIDDCDKQYGYYNYIYKSYSDRRKIKKWLLAELIPFLNNRIKYYLDKFGVDINIKFTSTLSDETDKWGYDFCSGGERKRIDLSIMFGLHDLYTSIYGQQCNIMVLDEVDGRLDNDGVMVFAEVVNDLSLNNDNLDAIIVISHKDELKNVFPRQIEIVKKDGFSHIQFNNN